MISKKQLKHIVLASALVCTATSAFAEAPLYRFEDGSSISALLSGSVAYNDNIYLAHKGKKGDTILTVSPGLEFLMGNIESESSLRLTVKDDIVFYMDETDNNSNLPHANLNYVFNGSKLRATVDAGADYVMTTSSRDYRDGQLVRYWYYYGNVLGTYGLSERLSVTSGFKWNGTTYTRGEDRYNDRQVYAIPVSLYHTVTEKLKAGLSYEYRYSDLAANDNQKGKYNPGCQEVHFFGVTATGDVTDKLDIDGRIGYTTSDWSRRNTSSNNDRTSTMGMGVSARYKVTDKTTTSLNLSRDFEIAGDGQGITSTGVQLSASHRLDDKWSLNALAAYKNDNYNSGNREDDVWTAQVGCSYRFSEALSFNASYRFQWDDSNDSTMSYTDNVVTLSLNFRY